MTDNKLVKCPPLSDQLTVEAWVESKTGRAEAMQALVSCWTPLAEFDRFDAFDAGHTDGLNSTGYFGAVFDGRYVYFSPEHEESKDTHGIVLRYDTQAPFQEQASYAAYDAGSTAGLRTRGYYGAGFDGRYVYFAPRQHGMESYHSFLLRYDTTQDFKSPAAWDAHDIGPQQSAQSCAFDGRYLYLSPGYIGNPDIEDQVCGNVLRYDTQADFHSAASYSDFDLMPHFGVRAACFDGAAFDGRYIYFVPLQDGVAARYDTQGAFSEARSWQTFDARPLGMSWCVGAVFDGQYLYYVPYDNGTIVRFDTRGDFAIGAQWSSYDARDTGGIGTNGFDGGYFDGRYIYFMPFVEKTDSGIRIHSNYLRYDATQPFADSASWTSHDASRASGLKSVGYNAGAFDGRYFYCAPWRHSSSSVPGQLGIHGVVLRHDTLGEQGSFSLRFCDYGHNGGLCAAVPGPSFLVNTERGVVGIAAHRALPPGKYHIAGVYDGQSVKLYINGELVAQRSGSGRIVACDQPVAVGHIHGGLANFEGVIHDVAISNVARGADEIRAGSVKAK